MVMGQEERRNKAKLEKTQISLATSNTEYESAVRALEETTSRWNREWKAAADKFQDLEEERLDYTKSSLWTFANIASTICVSDDAACEKIRLSLEKMDVEKDIVIFIKECGTGQEIPDPPRYINFCRGDVNDSQSEASEDESYSVAQFPRNINPAFRSSSPQPSIYESHHDPNSSLAQDLGRRDMDNPPSREATITPQKMAVSDKLQHTPTDHLPQQPNKMQLKMTQHGPFAAVPHDPYPLDGMTMLCRTGPSSERSSQVTSARPSSRDSQSDYSNPTSFSSQDQQSGKSSPVKEDHVPVQSTEKRVLKKKSGFFQNHSPFRRKSTKEVRPAEPNRNTWHASTTQLFSSGQARKQSARMDDVQERSSDRVNSPEPIDANASLALNVGRNVFPVTTPDLERRSGTTSSANRDDTDPIALALAELKGVTVGKQSSVRVSADHYHGIATPAPGTQPHARSIPTAVMSPAAAGMRGTPPPSYDQQVQRLGVPPQAVTARAMKETSQKFADQTRSMFAQGSSYGSDGYNSSSLSRPGTRGNDMPRATSPAPPRSLSPRPPSGDARTLLSSGSPSINGSNQRMSSQMARNRSSENGRYAGAHDMSRAASPAPYRDHGRPSSSMGIGEMAIQLTPLGQDGSGSQRGRNSGRPGTSSSSRAVGLYDGGSQGDNGSRQRSRSVADPSRQYTRDGRPILHFGENSSRNSIHHAPIAYIIWLI
jgi:hypothetical protein